MRHPLLFCLLGYFLADAALLAGYAYLLPAPCAVTTYIAWQVGFALLLGSNTLFWIHLFDRLDARQDHARP